MPGIIFLGSFSGTGQTWSGLGYSSRGNSDRIHFGQDSDNPEPPEHGQIHQSLRCKPPSRL